MIELIALHDPLDGEPRRFLDHRDGARLPAAEGAPVDQGEMLAEGVNEEPCGVEHKVSFNDHPPMKCIA